VDFLLLLLLPDDFFRVKCDSIHDLSLLLNILLSLSAISSSSSPVSFLLFAFQLIPAETGRKEKKYDLIFNKKK
jgi:hypothetical protein